MTKRIYRVPGDKTVEKQKILDLLRRTPFETVQQEIRAEIEHINSTLRAKSENRWNELEYHWQRILEEKCKEHHWDSYEYVSIDSKLLSRFPLEDVVKMIAEPDSTELDKEKIRQHLQLINTLH